MSHMLNGVPEAPFFTIYMNSQLCQNSSIPETINSDRVPQVGRGLNSRFLYTFNKKPVFTDESRMSVSNLCIPYSWYNIASMYGNNTFSYQFLSKIRNITIPDGFYSESDLNALLQSVMLKCGDYLVTSSGDNVFFLEIVLNVPKYRIQINSYSQTYGPLPTGYTIPSNWNSTYNDSIVSSVDVTTSNSFFTMSSGYLASIQPSTFVTTMSGSTAGTFPGGVIKFTDNKYNSTVANVQSLYTFFGLASTNSGYCPSTVSSTSPATVSWMGDRAPYQSFVECLFIHVSQVRNEFSCPDQIISTQELTAVQLNTTYGNNIVLDNFLSVWMPVQRGGVDHIQIHITDQAGRDVYLQDPRLSIELVLTHAKTV